jgi:predicted MFS family arabinose efflux permease
VLGGWLADAVSWRAIFFVNLPLAAGAIALALFAVPESRDDQAGPLDWLGALLGAVGLGALTWALTAAPDRGLTDPVVLSAGGASVLLLLGFVVAEAREKRPMMPLSLFKSAAFSGTNLLTLLLYFALSGAFFFLPFDLIRVQGMSATRAGAAMVPMPLIFGLLAGPGGRFADRFGPRWPLTLGPIVTGIGFALLALPDRGADYFTGYLPGLVVMSLGMSVTVGPLTATVMGAVEQRHAGVASGVNNAVARIAGLLAVASLGVVLSVAFSTASGGGPLARAALNATMAGALKGAAALDAFHHAVRVVLITCGACAAAGGAAAFLTLDRGKPAAPAA